MTDPTTKLHQVARAGGAVAESILDGETIEDVAVRHTATRLRETGERGSEEAARRAEHAALLTDSLIGEEDPCGDDES